MEGFWWPRQFLLKGPHIDLLGLTPSEFQQWGRGLKGTKDTVERSELSAIGERVGGQPSARQKCWTRSFCSFSKPFPNKASKWALNPRLHKPGKYYLPFPGDSLRLCHTQHVGRTKLFQVAFHRNDLCWLILQSCLKSLIHAALGISVSHISKWPQAQH